jgi:hypothetical protein
MELAAECGLIICDCHGDIVLENSKQPKVSRCLLYPVLQSVIPSLC